MDIALLLSLFLLIAMITVIVTDVHSYVIPNLLNLAILLLYIPAAYLFELDIAMALLAAGITLAIGLGIFTLGLMGGGDVKLTVVLMLWTGWSIASAQFMIYTALMGGVLVIVIGIARAIAYAVRPPTAEKPLPRILTRKQPVPYGVAIAGAFLILLFQAEVAGLPAPL